MSQSQQRDQGRVIPLASVVEQQQQPSAPQPEPPQQRGGSSSRKKRNVPPKSTKEEDDKNKGRKFFQQLQPIFSVATPAAKPRLEFLDHSDPAKDAVVRKKAREWVHRNKELAVVHTSGDFIQAPVASSGWIHENDAADAGEERGVHAGKKGRKKSGHVREKRDTLLRADPFWSVGKSRFDPFDQLPKVGRNVDHIIEYFLTSCPEEVPCSDDKFAFKPQKLMIEPKRENTVLANMAGEHVSYVLWLHATTFVRDGILGRAAEEESLWFYKQSLKVMQQALQRDVSEYTDCFLNAFACFTATSNFSGMFDAATMHCSAMVKAIKLRGGGDITKGILSCSSWTKKALQWCEFMVCAQLPQAPKIPYLPPRNAEVLPEIVIAEGDRLTFLTLANIPPVSDTFFNIIRWLHQLALAQGKPPPSTPTWPLKSTLDACVIRPLYDAEYALLQALAAQKAPHRGDYTETETLLSETCQLYLWMCPRGLPPEMAMCALFVARMKKAMLPLLGLYPLNADSDSEVPVANRLPTPPMEVGPRVDRYAPPSGAEPIVGEQDQLDNLLVWSLVLGTLVSRVHSRPEHAWFQEQLRLQLKAMGWEKRKDILKFVWTLFPHVEAVGWKNFKHLDLDLD